MARIPTEVANPLEGYFEDIFLGLLMGLLKTQSLEVGFGELRVRARMLTEKQISIVAKNAGAYYFEHLNPGEDLEKREIHALKIKALNHALRRLQDEE